MMWHGRLARGRLCINKTRASRPCHALPRKSRTSCQPVAGGTARADRTASRIYAPNSHLMHRDLPTPFPIPPRTTRRRCAGGVRSQVSQELDCHGQSDPTEVGERRGRTAEEKAGGEEASEGGGGDHEEDRRREEVAGREET